MSFSARNFVFGGVASENYEMVISSDGGETTSSVSDVEPLTAKPYRRTKNFIYGVNQLPVLTFPVTFHSLTGAISADDFNLISGWLFSQQNYKPLRIVQDDMTPIVFNAFLLNPQVIRVGNEIVGCKATVTCDSPFGYTDTKVTTYTYATPPSSVQINFFNYSQNSGYTYPTIEFTMAAGGGGLTIQNISDNGREFIFTTLLSLENVVVDNDLQIITSSTSLYRLSHFNLNFFRLVKGVNTLMVTGAISSLKISYPFAIKIGG
jgi:phage-related protein